MKQVIQLLKKLKEHRFHSFGRLCYLRNTVVELFQTYERIFIRGQLVNQYSET